MKKIFFVVLALCYVIPAWADVLLPWQRIESEEFSKQWKIKYEKGQKECPADKPLYRMDNTKNGIIGECFSCDELMNLNMVRECEKICHNRKSSSEDCTYSRRFKGFVHLCILQDAPGPDYEYVKCEGWVKKGLSKPKLDNDSISDSDRTHTRKTDQQVKKMKGCNSAKPILHTTIDKNTGQKQTKCYSCSWKGPIEFDNHKEALDCQLRCPKRSIISRDEKKWICVPGSER